MRVRPVLVCAFVCSTAVLVGLPLHAQESQSSGIRATGEGVAVVTPARTSAPDWGTEAYGVRTVHALGFQESVSTTAFSYNPSTTHRFRNGPGMPFFDYALTDLPAGALITGLELQGCDTNAAASIEAYLYRMNDSDLAFSVGSVSSGLGATPGCGFFGSLSNLPGTHAVDNFLNAYFIRVVLEAEDGTTNFGAVRVFYKLQVSPAPATATFTDVPTTHPFFRFVEALVDAGITAGCGGGNFCVDNPITRGEMAVFLSVALGLHFPY
jgi:hypothetical protein